MNHVTLHDFANGVILYGAGGKGRAVRNSLQGLGVQVLAFIDQNVREEVDGIRVFQPNAPELHAFATSRIPVVVAVFNHVTPPAPIYVILRAIGFDTIVGFMGLCQLINPGDTYWLSYSHPMVPEAPDASWLEHRLHDESSRQLLADVLAARRAGDILLLPQPTPENQYFPDDVPLPRHPIHFVDVGAFEGETIFALADNGFVFFRITAIEPDLLNFAKLSAAVARYAPCDDMVLLPCGLGQKNEFVSFVASGLPSSACGRAGSATALVVALDEVLLSPRVDYIKLDVEGAEIPALQGCKNIIQRHRPAIAVAVYHAPADLWLIPRLIDSLLPDSRFFLRSHGHNGFDLVLYAVP